MAGTLLIGLFSGQSAPSRSSSAAFTRGFAVIPSGAFMFLDWWPSSDARSRRFCDFAPFHGFLIRSSGFRGPFSCGPAPFSGFFRLWRAA